MEAQKIQLKSKLDVDALFKVSRFKEVIKKTKPHKHEGYYELIYLIQGAGVHWIEMEKYQIAAPELYFLKPGQVHYWQFTEIPKGFVLMFREDFIDSISEASMWQLLQNSRNIIRVSLTNAFRPDFIFEEMYKEYSENHDHCVQIIKGYIMALLSKTNQLNEVSNINKESTTKLHDRFVNLLAQKCPQLHLVQQYADLLQTSPQKLNAMCRKQYAKSAGLLIAEQIMLEAKRHLIHTDNPVYEIASMLHFNDTSYFVKFFRKHAGQTPLQFREQYQM
ncbi:MAG: AraC family transcriptional regulator [Cyclobacteriaceae bacterium]